MAEHDVTKHTKAIYDTIREPRKTWKQKLTDILVEILIIVFAISLSLLLERWREYAHDKTIEKKFLLGLRSDLQSDIRQLRNDSASYSVMYSGWNYLRNTGINNIKLNNDSLSRYGQSLIGTTEFMPASSRFEALKSSGQFNVIENDSLQNMILDLYQNKIITLRSTTTYLTQFKMEQLLPFLSKNIRYNKEGTSNIAQLITMPEMQNYLLMGRAAAEAMQRYHQVIEQSQQIIDMINKQYGN
jgi:hypothetical protein